HRFRSNVAGIVCFKAVDYQVSAIGHFPKTVIEHPKHMQGIGSIGKSVRDMKLIYHLITDENNYKSLYEKMDIDVLPINTGYPIDKATSELFTDLKEFLINKH